MVSEQRKTLWVSVMYAVNRREGVAVVPSAVDWGSKLEFLSLNAIGWEFSEPVRVAALPVLFYLKLL